MRRMLHFQEQDRKPGIKLLKFSLPERHWLLPSFYLVAGASYNGWEDSAGGVIASKPGFDQARAIVTYQGGGLIVVTHVWCFRDGLL